MPSKPDTSMLRMFNCPQLNGKGDFEPWWVLVEDLFYFAGLQDFWDDGSKDIDVDDEDAVNDDLDFNAKDASRHARRRRWPRAGAATAWAMASTVIWQR